jgi:hypothetical protein
MNRPYSLFLIGIVVLMVLLEFILSRIFWEPILLVALRAVLIVIPLMMLVIGAVTYWMRPSPESRKVLISGIIVVVIAGIYLLFNLVLFPKSG